MDHQRATKENEDRPQRVEALDRTVLAAGSAAGPSGVAETVAESSAVGPSGVADTLAASLEGGTTLRLVNPDCFVDRSELKRGGMGRILSARDPRLRRTVAIKELRTDSPELRARFEREALLTARLEHPSIVGIHEAGRWPSGAPFFAMRLVRGRSLDEAIAATTSFSERIALVPHVLAVADALAYAHHERVIHRDLKPQNVMVGDFGETVVIDWGLAKDLADTAPDSERGSSAEPRDPSSTTDGEILGTPHYMPPEQAEGHPVDERADVYAIGALLYHVLAGVPPYEGATTAAVLDAVTSRAPTPLAERQSNVPPDLLAIVERAMARDPAARYRSGRELAEDLRRFQGGQLVGAHRYSISQLLRRWVTKHRGAVIVATVAVAVLLLSGAIGIRRIVQEEHRAIAARELADHNRADAEELLRFMLYDLSAKLEPLGKLDVLDAVVRKARDYYERQEVLGPDEQLGRARARHQLGVVLLAQGDGAGALVEYRAGQAIAEALARAHPDVRDVDKQLLTSERAIGDVLMQQGSSAAALVSYRASLEIATRVVALAPGDTEAGRQLAVTHGRIGDVLEARGELAGALAEFSLYRNSVAALAGSSADQNLQRSLAIAHERVGGVLRAQGDLVAARFELEAAKTVTEVLLERTPTDASLQRDLMVSDITLGELIAQQGDGLAALVSYRAALALSEALSQQDPTNADARRDLAISHLKIGELLEEQHDDALVEYRSSLAIMATLATKDPTNTGLARDVAVGHMAVARMLAGSDARGALAEYHQGLDILEGLATREPSNTILQGDLIAGHLGIGQVLAKGDRAMALIEFGASLAFATERSAGDPTDLGARRMVEVIHNKIGDLHMRAKDSAAALAAYRASKEIAVVLADQDPSNGSWQHDLAITLMSTGEALESGGDAAGAFAEYRAAHEIFDKLIAKDPRNERYKDDLGALDREERGLVRKKPAR